MIHSCLYLIDFNINQVNFEGTNYRAIFTEHIVVYCYIYCRILVGHSQKEQQHDQKSNGIYHFSSNGSHWF